MVMEKVQEAFIVAEVGTLEDYVLNKRVYNLCRDLVFGHSEA